LFNDGSALMKGQLEKKKAPIKGAAQAIA